VGIEGVVLEDHGDIAVFGGDIVDEAVADVDFAGGDLFEARDHAERGGLAAARRPDEHHEFLVFDDQVGALDGVSYSATLYIVFSLVYAVCAIAVGLLFGAPLAHAVSRGLREVSRLDHQAVPSNAYWQFFRLGAFRGAMWRAQLLWILWIPAAAALAAMAHDAPMGAAPFGAWIGWAVFPFAVALWHAIAAFRFGPEISPARWGGAFGLTLANVVYVALLVFTIDIGLRAFLPDGGIVSFGRAEFPSGRVGGPNRYVGFAGDVVPVVHLVIAFIAALATFEWMKRKGARWFPEEGNAAA
jgi:hypothetical protein